MLWLAGISGLVCALLFLALATPRRWWQKPTALAAGLLFATCMLCAGGIYQLLQIWGLGQAAQLPQEIASRALNTSDGKYDNSAVAGIFRVKHRLNLRQSASTSARHLTQLEAQQIVHASGQRIGDWWLVRSCSAGQMQEGWVNSLWLRRLQELPAKGEPITSCAN